MAVIDVILIIVVAGGLIIGYGKGALRQLGSIGGVVAGILACRLAGERTAQWVASMSDKMSDTTAQVVGYALLFLVVWCAVWLIVRIIRRATHALCLGPVDGLLGALFLAFKWLMVVSLALNLWKAIDSDSALFSSSKLAEGKLLEMVVDLTPTVFGHLHDFATNHSASLL